MEPGSNPATHSPKTGFWPDPRKEKFNGLSRTHKSQVLPHRAKGQRIYLQDEYCFFISETNAPALKNKYECLIYVNNDNDYDVNNDINNIANDDEYDGDYNIISDYDINRMNDEGCNYQLINNDTNQFD